LVEALVLGRDMQQSICRRSVLLVRCAVQPCHHPPLKNGFVVVAALFFLLLGWFVGQAAFAETTNASKPALLAQQKKHNETVLMILGGVPGTPYFRLAHDMVTALGTNHGLRLLAIDAPGGIETLRDLLLLRGIDLALVSANALTYANETTSFGPGLQQRLTYIAQLYGEEVHILVGRGIKSLVDLNGKKIAVPPDDGNSEFSAQDLLRRLRIDAEVVKVAAPDAIDDVRSGAFAALLLVGGKPLRFVAGLPKDGSLRLLAVPSTQPLGDGYLPTGFRSDDYPTLIPDGQTIDTVSISAVLVANNTPKSDESNRRVTRFVPAFFDALSELAGPQWHPKWTEVNLAAPLAGWSRFATAEEWLDRAKREQMALVQRGFEGFLSATRSSGSPPLSPKARSELFEEFVKWTRNSMGKPGPTAARP
jgi:TRAP-type uncharacterized transport system substrate-binding protein